MEHRTKNGWTFTLRQDTENNIAEVVLAGLWTFYKLGLADASMLPPDFLRWMKQQEKYEHALDIQMDYLNAPGKQTSG